MILLPFSFLAAYRLFTEKQKTLKSFLLFTLASSLLVSSYVNIAAVFVLFLVLCLLLFFLKLFKTVRCNFSSVVKVSILFLLANLYWIYP